MMYKIILCSSFLLIQELAAASESKNDTSREVNKQFADQFKHYIVLQAYSLKRLGQDAGVSGRRTFFAGEGLFGVLLGGIFGYNDDATKERRMREEALIDALKTIDHMNEQSSHNAQNPPPGYGNYGELGGTGGMESSLRGKVRGKIEFSDFPMVV